MTEHEFYRRLGIRIRQARQRHGWSQLRLGMELDVTPVAVHYWETAQHRPDLYRIRQLEKVLGQEVAL
jgi:ribosome-binding protein aMBF1 (putative translation factor)